MITLLRVLQIQSTSRILEWDNKKPFVYDDRDDGHRNDGKETTERYIRIGTSAQQMESWWNKNKYEAFKPRTLDRYVPS